MSTNRILDIVQLSDQSFIIVVSRALNFGRLTLLSVDTSVRCHTTDHEGSDTVGLVTIPYHDQWEDATFKFKLEWKKYFYLKLEIETNIFHQ